MNRTPTAGQKPSAEFELSEAASLRTFLSRNTTQNICFCRYPPPPSPSSACAHFSSTCRQAAHAHNDVIFLKGWTDPGEAKPTGYRELQKKPAGGVEGAFLEPGWKLKVLQKVCFVFHLFHCVWIFSCCEPRNPRLFGDQVRYCFGS